MPCFLTKGGGFETSAELPGEKVLASALPLGDLTQCCIRSERDKFSKDGKMDTDKGWGSSQLFLAAKKTGVYSKLITEASFVVVGEQQAPPRNALSFSSWMSVLARPVRRSACGFLLVLAEPRRVTRSKPSHGRPLWGAGCPVPRGRENTPQRVAARPQETLYLQTFLQDPRFFIYG